MAGWHVGDVIDDLYQVMQVHEQGGLGLVYRVRHLEWDTELAVKSLRPELRTNDNWARFIAEAETWVSLGVHPHVCCCHYVRTTGGIPRAFAEYVPGGDLRDWIVDGRLHAGSPADARARILDLAIQVAWGLDHAHARGLVHQDVKPANVLVDTDGTAKITDFGLAKFKDAGASLLAELTPGATVLVTTGGMTPAYASPEQALAQPVGRRSDIYSFAVSVLEMFTGAITWLAGPLAGDALRALPTGVIPHRVAELLHRCLATDPAARPASMAEVAEELIASYTQETGQRFPRTAPQPADLRADELNNRALSMLDLDRADEAQEAFQAALATDPRHLAATYNFALLRWRAGAITDDTAVTEVEAVGAGTADPSTARHLLGLVHLERGDRAQARLLIDEAFWDNDTGAARVAGSGCDDRRDAPWQDHPARPWSGRLSPVPPVAVRFDGAGARVLTGSWDGAITLWDTNTGEQLSTLTGHTGRVHALDLSADGRTAISVGADHTVRVWDLAERRCRHVFDLDTPDLNDYMDYSACLTPDGRTGLWAGADDRVHVVDLATGLRRHVLQNQYDAHAVAIAATDQLALTSAGQVWDLATGQCVRRLIGLGVGTGASIVHLSADGRLGLTAGFPDTTIQVWDLGTGRCVRHLPGHTDVVRSLALSPDGRFALSGGADRTMRLWDLVARRCLRTFREHTGEVNAVLLSPDATSALSTAQDDTLRHWSLPCPHYLAPPQLARPRTHFELTTLHEQTEALVVDAEQALAGGRHRDALDLLAKARAVPSHERSPRVLAAWRALARHTSRAGVRAMWPGGTLGDRFTTAVDLSADGRFAMTAGVNGTVTLWDLDLGAGIGSVTEPAHRQLRTACLSADARTIVTAASDDTPRLWNPGSGTELHELDAATMIRTIKFSRTGDRLIAAGWNDLIHVWDVESGRRTRTLHNPGGRGLGPISISRDGRFAVTSTVKGPPGLPTGPPRLAGTPVPPPPIDHSHVVRLWNLDRGENVLTMTGHSDTVTSVCMSPGGKVVASGSDDHTIRLWDAETGACLRTVDNVAAPALHLRFGPDSRFVVAGHADAAIRIWDISSGQCVYTTRLAKPPVDLELSADGWLLLSRGKDEQVQVWHLDWDLFVPEPVTSPPGDP